MTDLLDINVWLALVDERHVHHPRARHYWDHEAAEQMAFCRTTMLGFMRLSTHAKVMADPLTTTEAWDTYRQLLALPSVCFLDEPRGIEQRFHGLSTGAGFIHRLWTDAYLAAFAQAHPCRLVSFDGDFKRFEGLHLLCLSASES